MSRVVYKYGFELADEVTIPLPNGFEVLRFDTQNGRYVMWALVDPAERVIEPGVRFLIRGTGHPVPDGHKYLTSFYDGPFVWHVFQGWVDWP